MKLSKFNWRKKLLSTKASKNSCYRKNGEVYHVKRRLQTRIQKREVLPALVMLYLISPLDIIPDWIPVIGVLDDLALLAMAIPMLTSEAEKFVAWEASRKTKR